MKTVVEFEPIDVDAITYRQIAFMEAALKREVPSIISDAKANITKEKIIKTGSLLSAVSSKIKSSKTKVYAIIGINTKYVTYDEYGNKIRPSKYAALLEFGTKYITPTFFLTKAGDANKSKIINALKKAATEGIE
jgi:HK97 gp10 family phage protein